MGFMLQQVPAGPIPRTEPPPPGPINRLIDWSHPLAKDLPMRGGLVAGGIALNPYLRSLFIFDSERPRDLAKTVQENMFGGDPTYISGGGGSAATFNGRSLDCTSNGQCVNFASPYTYNYSAVPGFSRGYTQSALIRFPLSQSLTGWIGNDRVYWNGTTFFTFGANMTYDPANIAAGWRRITSAAAFSTSGEATLYVDGEAVASGGTHSGGTFTIDGIGNMSITLARDRGVEFRDFFLWEGCLSDEAILWHYRDPYCMLKPALPDNVYAFPEAAAPGGGVPPLFHHHRHHNRAG